MFTKGDVIKYSSVLTVGGIRLLLFIAIFFGFLIPLFSSLNSEPLIISAAMTAYIFVIYIPLLFTLYERNKSGAVIILMDPKELTVFQYGRVISCKWSDIRSVKARGPILLASAGRIGGINIETSLSSGKFFKSTIDIFIPDQFEVTNDFLAEQIVNYKCLTEQ